MTDAYLKTEKITVKAHPEDSEGQDEELTVHDAIENFVKYNTPNAAPVTA